MNAYNQFSINQAGAIKAIQGAKEQYLINMAISESNKETTQCGWIDITKAYDTINQGYLIECIVKMGAPTNIIEFLKLAMSNWNTKLFKNGRMIGATKFNRGILQGDCLSPLLFIIAMEPISRHLNLLNEKINVNTEVNKCTSINHLIYIDDFKIFGKTTDDVLRIEYKLIDALKNIGMEINKDKSARSSQLLEKNEKYKYLGIFENHKNIHDDINFKLLKDKILERCEQLIETHLNARNLIFSINEFAISLLNYYTGLINISNSEMEALDTEIRNLLYKHKISYKNSSIERLYIKRDSGGRGLKNCANTRQRILLNMYLYIVKKDTIRKKIIYHNQNSKPSNILKIKEELNDKYMEELDEIKSKGTEQELSNKLLIKLQEDKISKKLKSKSLHGVYMSALEEKLFDKKNSVLWLKKGNHNPRQEALMVYLQDRNTCFTKQKCNYCHKSIGSIDHKATKCPKLLHNEYIRRHNEITKSIHFALARKYGFTKHKKLKDYKMESIIKNQNAKITVELPIKTDIILKEKKPDLVVHDYIENTIYIIEIGISSIDNLVEREIEKLKKYDILAKEMKMIEKKNVYVIPFVITWDGIVTKYNQKYRNLIDINDKILSYIQYKSLIKTAEISNREMCFMYNNTLRVPEIMTH